MRRQFSCSLIPHSLKRLAKKSRSQHEEKRLPQRVTSLLSTPPPLPLPLPLPCSFLLPLRPLSILQAPPQPSRRLLLSGSAIPEQSLSQPPLTLLTAHLLILLFSSLLGNLRLRLRRSSLCCCFCVAWGFWHGINL